MHFPLARHESLVVQDLPDEILICDTETYRAFCLNKTAAEVWRLCDGKTDVQQIANSLSKKLGSPINEDLIWLALDQLSKENLLQKSVPLSEKFGTISRREVIRRIGLATVVALPVISSLAMPTAAMAQSAGSCDTSPLPSDCACLDCSECDSNCCFDGTCQDSTVCDGGGTCGDGVDCPPGFSCCGDFMDEGASHNCSACGC
jgi:hypothetical protein